MESTQLWQLAFSSIQLQLIVQLVRDQCHHDRIGIQMVKYFLCNVFLVYTQHYYSHQCLIILRCLSMFCFLRPENNDFMLKMFLFKHIQKKKSWVDPNSPYRPQQTLLSLSHTNTIDISQVPASKLSDMLW